MQAQQMNDHLVLDNSVLSSFHTSGWLNSLDELSEDYNLLASESIWKEFETGRKIESPPDWLTVERVDRFPYLENIGGLSVQDMTCISLAEIYSGKVVANDYGLKKKAESHGLQTVWGTRFLIDIFESCMLSQSEFDNGKQDYIEDLFLNQRIEKAIHQAEKPD